MAICQRLSRAWSERSRPHKHQLWFIFIRPGFDLHLVNLLQSSGRHVEPFPAIWASRCQVGLILGPRSRQNGAKISLFSVKEECGDVGKHPGVAVSRLNIAPWPRLPFSAPQSGCFLRLFEEKHRRDLGRGYAPTEPFVRVTSADITTRLTSQQSSCRNGAAGFSCSVDGKQGLPQGNVKRGMCGENMKLRQEDPRSEPVNNNNI